MSRVSFFKHDPDKGDYTVVPLSEVMSQLPNEGVTAWVLIDQDEYYLDNVYKESCLRAVSDLLKLKVT